jgi:hypothetical protein
MTKPLVTRDEVCEVIDLWQARHGEGSVVTRAFVADVRRGEITRWKNVNAHDLFVFSSPRPRLLLALRSAIVLIPILLTWLAISQVIDPYATYVQNVDSSANFLWFWQSNPGGNFASYWRLSHVAIVDAMLLAALVVLSVRISWRETAVLERDERDYGELIQVVHVALAETLDPLVHAQPEPSSQLQLPLTLHPELAPR